MLFACVRAFFVICASAKTGSQASSILGAMDTPIIHLQLTVKEVLQRWPSAFSVFTKNKTKCPGCFMQQFCTLKEVAETYQIPPEKLIAEIENVSDPNTIQRSIL